MSPTIASPLASIASGAAQPLAAGLASALVPSSPLPGDGSGPPAGPAGIADSFAPIARSPRAPSGAAGARARSRPRPGGAGYAARSTTTAEAGSSAAAKKGGPLAFLDDRNLSVEEKLMRLLAYLSAKWDKDLEKKLKEFETGQQKGSGAPAAPKKKSGGLLGSVGAIVKAASAFFPGVGVALEALRNPAVRAVVSRIGGPVLAAAASALGHPALAPVLLKYGPAVVDLAAGIATSLEGGSAPSAGSSAGGSGGASGAGSSASETGMNDSQMRLKLMEIQRIQDLQKEMFSMVSNILRVGHETRMNVIQNVR